MSISRAAQTGGNLYPKYTTKNIFARILVAGFLRCFDHMVERTGSKTIFECGCGEGYLSLRLLKAGYQVTGCDIGSDAVAFANQQSQAQGFGAPFVARDILDFRTERDIADLVICCEMLEHTEQPKDILHTLNRLTRDWVLLSVPHEPLWSMMNITRLAYVEDFGNTPGHIQRWSKRAFRDLVGEVFDIVEIKSQLPWTFILARKRK